MHQDDDFSGFDEMYPQQPSPRHVNGTPLSQLQYSPTPQPTPTSTQTHASESNGQSETAASPQRPLTKREEGKTADPTPWAKRDLESATERHKRCAKCRELKPISAFPKHDTSGDGYASYCKRCRNGLNQKRRRDNPVARLKHHIATRVQKQLEDCKVPEIPAGLTRDLEIYLGYSITELVKKLTEELKRDHNITLKEAFRQGWHLDHIHPLWTYKVKEVGDITFKECWAICNLKMVPSEVNLAKGGKIGHKYD